MFFTTVWYKSFSLLITLKGFEWRAYVSDVYIYGRTVTVLFIQRMINTAGRESIVVSPCYTPAGEIPPL